MNRCIIIGAGDLSLDAVKISDEDYVIAADGGFVYCRLLGIEPDCIIGDFDSLKEEELSLIKAAEEEKPERVVYLPSEKDDTDMLAALKVGLEKGYQEFILYGAMGGRLEHTIANIQCLIFLKEHNAKGYLMDEDSMVLVAANETVTFQKELEGMVSVFCMGERAEGVNIHGMKYLLENASLSYSFPIGISNELIGEEGTISVKNGTLAVIVRW